MDKTNVFDERFYCLEVLATMTRSLFGRSGEDFRSKYTVPTVQQSDGCIMLRVYFGASIVALLRMDLIMKNAFHEIQIKNRAKYKNPLANGSM